mgnify:CR=1 FL=1
MRPSGPRKRASCAPSPVDFASGRIDAKAAADRCAVVAAKVAHDNPDVTIVAVAPERFAGEFAISATNYVLDAGEQAYVDRQKRLIDDLAADEAADIKSSIPMRALKSAAPSAGTRRAGSGKTSHSGRKALRRNGRLPTYPMSAATTRRSASGSNGSCSPSMRFPEPAAMLAIT